MTTNFFAILRSGEETIVKRIRVSADVQDELEEEFERQADLFLSYSYRQSGGTGRGPLVTEESERVAFFPIYTLPDNSQIFELPGFSLEDVIDEGARNPETLDALVLEAETIPLVRAICAVVSTKDSLKICFQAFDRRRILNTAKWTFLQSGEVFSRLDKPGLTIGDTIAAIYENGTLLFRSFAVTSRFLNLNAVLNEASNEQITEALSHPVFAVDDLQGVLANVDTVMRKQFAAISKLKVLDEVKPDEVKTVAAEFEIEISVSTKGKQQRIDFPKDKKSQKELLKFLTEGLYKGVITGIAYQSNSHRPRKPKGEA
jgi:hypothetical protein